MPGGPIIDFRSAAAKGHLGSNWPKSSSAFSAELRRIAPQLRVHGISIHFERRREGRVVSLSVENGKTAGSKPSITDLRRARAVVLQPPIIQVQHRKPLPQ